LHLEILEFILFMKKILLSVALFFTATSYAQDSTYNAKSIDFGVGFANVLTPGQAAGYSGKFLDPLTLNLGYRYMLSRDMGVSANLGYNNFSSTKDGKTYSANNVVFTLNGYLNLRSMLNFAQFNDKIGLLMHVGAGGSADFFKRTVGMGRDLALLANFGFTPQYKINDKIALNLDVTLNVLKLQQYTLDMQQVKSDVALGKMYATGTVGVNYYFFGDKKDKVHADWAAKFDRTKSDIEDLKNKVKSLENKLVDTDKDGVADYLDLEPNTPEGSSVNSHGQKVVDTDGDGIVDTEDYCPTVKGTAEFKGCPTAVGSTTTVVTEGKEIEGELKFKVAKNASDVTFDTKSTAIKTNFKSQLEALAKQLNENPSLVLTVNGHCDNVGEDILNNKLSLDRANAVKDFLVSKGVSASRIKTVGHGTSQPKFSNDTEKGRAANRRVELVVKTK
jgi:OOP family OmpA-OmpF porin